ncbi:glutamate--cysteine ligase [Gayadomonas joobiniege]|uniref:glutamate--cysteine ligase n=1 Tax=Gayadomonas joobiniege TaxID=1234606 RepID=UPI0003710436|nr:glutamate--cysteine ligase [Gayadomonas joobiniege]
MNLADNLHQFFTQQGVEFAQHINRGIEKEALRIQPNGHLAVNEHPRVLGSALTHPYITTDYSESLLEFITPVEQNIQTTLQQLADVHKFVYQKQPNDLLWPMSMPCFVGDESDILIAQYGRSNVGRMKTLYREGLKNRYGSTMQVISGVHFNFSFPALFFEQLAKAKGRQADQAFISEIYLAVLRNVKRYLWLLCYLFGASPALCGSFLKNTQTNYNFKTVGKGTLYLPYATSLRLSDLGYTNKAQAALNIRYNQLDEYIAGLKKAIQLPSEEFSSILAGQNGIYHQLNANILQIENEYYSPVRPKRVARSGEKPSEALARGGVQYIEIRALDVDPFDANGISEAQTRFMDLFLTWCALQDSPPLETAEEQVINANLQAVIMQGRKPGLTLQQGDHSITLADWAEQTINAMNPLADWMSAPNETAYQAALKKQAEKVANPDLTPSGKIMNRLLNNNMDNSQLGLDLAKQYQKDSAARDYQYYSEQALVETAEKSLLEQTEIEKSDKLAFTDYLAEYFN